ncbi:MAG TPA: phosphoribosyltransferase family protein [Rhizomicrobium sp.]
MTLTPLFTATQIRERVEALAQQIATASLKPDIALPVLAGSFVFAADLLRALATRGLSLPMEFIWLRSYGTKREGREVTVLVGPPEELHGRTALLIDGVLDRGHTLARAHALLLERGATTVLTAVAVDKARTDAAFRADYAAFINVSDFIVGYGMDEASRHRGLPYIARAEATPSAPESGRADRPR